MIQQHGNRFGSAALALMALLTISGCGRGPFDDYGIRATGMSQAPRLEFLRARVGMKFLEVQFEFENRAKEPLTLKALDFALRDEKGTLYPFSAQTLDLGQPRGQAYAVIAPEQMQDGAVVFQIPSAAVPAALIYRQDLAGGLVIMLTGPAGGG